MSTVGACTINVMITATTCVGSLVLGGGLVLVQSIGCGVDSQKYWKTGTGLPSGLVTMRGACGRFRVLRVSRVSLTGPRGGDQP